ncbi:hypothetical protein IE81DRAFT_139344 [Ceraceosorus guamensis]|uniref:Uncharacterized protein n=1 Tax=Ceraceosorus guamensis TaxID=1522189 RepID=A0A316W0E8_9BASI|nr:hypothetical protein IE81DRAFT_139344 [Ceraceosorus guamensis]PWN42183.1 hypothetical protein IE81DRAFT_139344 [Ceraceosorus guamensis]
MRKTMQCSDTTMPTGRMRCVSLSVALWEPSAAPTALGSARCVMLCKRLWPYSCDDQMHLAARCRIKVGVTRARAALPRGDYSR